MRPMRRSTPTAAAVLATCLFVAGPATAAELPGVGNLSPRLAKLARPSVRSASEAVQASKLSLPAEGPGSLLRQGNRVLVYARFDRGAIAGLPDLRQAGAEVVDASSRYQTVTVAAKPAELQALDGVPRVAALVPALAPVAAEACEGGAVVSKGVGQMRAGGEAEEARGKFGVDGSEVTVGILSDSFDSATEAATHARQDEESGDLPGPNDPCLGQQEEVEVLDEIEPEFESEEASDEGRAMAQIVHDVAPAAKIEFATAYKPDLFGFAENIGKLAKAGAEVIADDVYYFEEPFFQDGPVAVAATEAIEGGASYLSAAGNDNLIEKGTGNEIASWETPAYRDAGSCPREVQVLPGFNGTHCLDFDPGPEVDRSFGIRVAPGRTLIVDLQWDEPWEGVETDLDPFLLDANGRLIALDFEANEETGMPVEVLGWKNSSSSARTVQLVVNRYSTSSGADPRVKLGLLENGRAVEATEYPRSSETDTVGPTIFGHSGSAGVVSVGAMDVGKTSEPERYSSRGPVRHDFGPVTGTEPAEELESPEILSKPDVVAGDCGATTFFAEELTGGTWRFCGTSAAAPHAAGVAALMLEAEPGTPPDEIHTALQESGASIGSPPFGPCAVGAGLVDAVKAIEALPVAGGYSPPECPVPSPQVSDAEARAPGDWGTETPPSTTAVPPSPASEPQTTPVRPRTFIRIHPPRLIRTRHRRAKVVFRFGSDEKGVHYVCRIDAGLFKPCPRRLVRRFGVGWHTLRVAARDADGNGDRTPALYRFRVKRIR